MGWLKKKKKKKERLALFCHFTGEEVDFSGVVMKKGQRRILYLES